MVIAVFGAKFQLTLHQDLVFYWSLVFFPDGCGSNVYTKASYKKICINVLLWSDNIFKFAIWKKVGRLRFKHFKVFYISGAITLLLLD